MFTNLIIRRGLFARDPMQTLAHLFIARVVLKHSPKNLFTLANTLGRFIGNAISELGVIRTLQVLNVVKEGLNLKYDIPVLSKLLENIVPITIIDSLIQIIGPDWAKLLRNNMEMSKVLKKMMFVVSSFLIIKPFYRFSIRTIFIFFFAVFGIIYTPILSSYKILRDFVNFLLSFVPQSLIEYFPNKIRKFWVKY